MNDSWKLDAVGMWFNQLYNSVGMFAIWVVLATEGIKTVAAMFGCPIKGKPALFLFLAVMLLMMLESGGIPKTEFYFLHSFIRLLGMIGLYNFFTRLLAAIERRSSDRQVSDEDLQLSIAAGNLAVYWLGIHILEDREKAMAKTKTEDPKLYQRALKVMNRLEEV